ncbi:MAG TPA: hypothetical protein PKN95_07755 [Verrucomicrobiota bacterium]|nr:hypothetical protein [Verrucomicrobiota bacterium]HNT15024.1 hypothetical protein [Verrucomicrobiota bacterium]
MSAVSESIVREYFELHQFLVRQQRKYVTPTQRETEDIDFYVFNPLATPCETAPPFILTSADLAGITRAIVVVKGWHTETFSPARLAGAPGIFRFVSPKVFQRAARTFGLNGTPWKILIVPTLPHSAEAREKSILLLRSRGVDAVIPFRTLLADLVQSVGVNRNYQKSDLLQTIRILKNYDFFKGPQLELFKTTRRGRPRV